MNKNFLVIILVSLGFASLGQNQQLLDSLLRGARIASTDSLKAEYHYELCYQWADYNFDSAMFHATKMTEIAKSSGDELMKYQSLE